ncbi:hypothetical protein SAMN05216188_116199 [Lentzea xinjiangensis]|uniref:Uncharacterized protein n=2 Tax=Lentzea xinjiangensis TaxID=402600 RepID=A0A1H9SRU2_9PSEU|nr:hypothetical protein SAMN05216188_116199 [Lentzea xinjiangensis]
MAVFGHSGVPPELTAVYELLVPGGSRTTDEVGVAPALPARRHELGDVWQVVAPDLAVEALIAAREEANRRARVTPTLPFKLALADAHATVLPVVHGAVIDEVPLIRVQAMRRGWL